MKVCQLRVIIDKGVKAYDKEFIVLHLIWDSTNPYCFIDFSEFEYLLNWFNFLSLVYKIKFYDLKIASVCLLLTQEFTETSQSLLASRERPARQSCGKFPRFFFTANKAPIFNEIFE